MRAGGFNPFDDNEPSKLATSMGRLGDGRPASVIGAVVDLMVVANLRKRQEAAEVILVFSATGGKGLGGCRAGHDHVDVSPDALKDKLPAGLCLIIIGTEGFCTGCIWAWAVDKGVMLFVNAEEAVFHSLSNMRVRRIVQLAD